MRGFRTQTKGRMMDVYRRYFRVESGPLIEAVKECLRVNAEANEQYKKIISEIGAKPGYYHVDHRLVGFCFEKAPDRNIFKSARNGWYPKKNCKEGKALYSRLKAIATKDPDDYLHLVGLRHSPTVFSELTCYWPTITVIPEAVPVVYVSVPWHDADPAEVERYKQDHAAGKRSEANFEAILWEPTAEMVEVKKWQVERHISEFNESAA